MLTGKMKLSGINIYPVKSLKGIPVEEATVEDRGFQYDRRWMLIDANNRFLSQREHPVMATISVAVTKDGLFFKRGRAEILVPMMPQLRRAYVQIWTSYVEAMEYGDRVNGWFSEQLEMPCRLVLMPEESRRSVDAKYALRPKEDTVSFADGYPFLLIGEGSLEDLNIRLSSPVPMNRFRPNLVVKGSEPFAEDTWSRIRIGETIFHLVKPCGRCVMTTVDQASGEKDGKEPLRTLASYRTVNGSVLFGQNLIAENAGGIIRVGDEVEVVEVRSEK